MPVKFEPVSGKSLLYFKQYPKPKRVGFDKTSDTLGNLNEEPWGGTVRSMLWKSHTMFCKLGIVYLWYYLLLATFLSFGNRKQAQE